MEVRARGPLGRGPAGVHGAAGELRHRSDRSRSRPACSYQSARMPIEHARSWPARGTFPLLPPPPRPRPPATPPGEALRNRAGATTRCSPRSLRAARPARRPCRRNRLAQAARAAALGRTTIRWPTLSRVAGPLSTGLASAGTVSRHRLPSPRAPATSRRAPAAAPFDATAAALASPIDAAAARRSAAAAHRCSAAALLSCARARSAVAASRRRRSPRRPAQAVCSSEQCV